MAVQGGRDIAPIINELLTWPFTIKVATKDWHPQNHISFASNHPPPNNIPFESTHEYANPLNPAEKDTIRLWPNHCVQGTKGADLIPELDVTNIQCIIEKGQDQRVEMYSAFADPFLSPTVSPSKLAHTLRDAGVSHVYVVGLAMDYCVKHTALHSAKEGFRTFVIEEATKAVSADDWEKTRSELAAANVELVSIENAAVQQVRDNSE